MSAVLPISGVLDVSSSAELDFGVSLDYLRIEKFKVDLMNLKFLANDLICVLAPSWIATLK